MQNNLNTIKLFVVLFFVSAIFLGCKPISKEQLNSATNLVLSNDWYISGPTIETEGEINNFRKSNGVIQVTTNNLPVGEIELNVMITPSSSNDGPATRLNNNSTFLQVTYKSSHLIKLQAREGDKSGSGCIHGGSHPRVDLQASPDKFATINIPWKNFRLDGKPDGKLLDINNLCKLNFVNYNPVAKSTLEISSVKIEGFKL